MPILNDDLVADGSLAAVGPRLRDLRHERGSTLTQLAEVTGISVSTLSRLESGRRRPSLELLLPLARAHQVTLDDLVGATATADPRVHGTPIERRGMTFVPLSRQVGGVQAYKQTVQPGAGCSRDGRPKPMTHDGYEWMYVLSGRVRLLLGEHDLVLKAGEAAEFDTRTPHAVTAAGSRPAEILNLFGPQGERMHVRAKPKGR